MESPHLKRWMTGVIATPVLFAVVLFSPAWLFAIFIAFVILMGMMEYCRMVLSDLDPSWLLPVLILAVLIPAAAYAGDPRIILGALSLSFIVISLIFIFRSRHGHFDVPWFGKLILGFVYVPFLLSHLILVRGAEKGIQWIFFIIVMAFAGDISAFYVGRTLGRRKLLPSVSPGKTIEGTIGLVIGSMAACLLYRYLFLPELRQFDAAVMGIMGSLLGQMGDLFESSIKRASGVKDSGVILPGHGGIMDRLDCILFIAPFVYYYKLFLV
jgi:phosphatidate cytidylyltransferase